MTAEDISQRVVDILNAHNVAYMVVGSLSTNFHSIVRSTKDADIVVQSVFADAARLIAREFPELQLDPQIGFESVTGARKLVLRTDVGEGFIVEVFELTEDAHDQERFRRRLLVDWGGHPTWIATAEDAVVTKTRWAHSLDRKKDMADIETVIGVRGDGLDWPYIEAWCQRHGSHNLLVALRENVERRLSGE
jgi:hypothetical protein